MIHAKLKHACAKCWPSLIWSSLAKKKKCFFEWVKMRKEYFIAHKVLLIKTVEIVSIMSLIEC